MADTTVYSPFELLRSGHIVTDETKAGQIIIAVTQNGVMRQMDKAELLLWAGIGSAPNLTQVLTVGNDAGTLGIVNLTSIISTTATMKVDLTAGQLIFNQVLKYDVKNGFQQDSIGIKSISQESRILYDANGVANITWANGVVIAGLAGSGAGAVAVDNTGLLSFVVGVTKTGTFTTFTIINGIITAAT